MSAMTSAKIEEKNRRSDPSNWIEVRTAEGFLGFFVQIADSNSTSQDTVVRVFDGHGSRFLCRQVIQFDCCHTWMKEVDHLQSNGGLDACVRHRHASGNVNTANQTYWIDIVKIKTIAEFGNT